MNDNSDDAISETLEQLKQEGMINDSLANGRGAWTVVYDSWRDEQGRFYGGRYACFARPDLLLVAGNSSQGASEVSPLSALMSLSLMAI